jgi:hypothetical protein
MLRECFPDFQGGQWLRFETDGGVHRFCQVDGLLMGEALVLFEVKMRFTSDAYFQLHRLYKPVVEKALGRRVEAMVQICRYFDPFAPFPEPVKVLEEISLEAIRSVGEGRMGVFVWKI